MKCPFCGKLNTRVVDSRPGKAEFDVRRRRECRKCSKRFTTHERFIQVPVIIVKEDGRREDDFEKIRISAHSIKGSAGSIEAAQMQAAAYAVEKVAKDQQKEQISETMDDLEMEFEILSEILKDEIAESDCEF